MSHDPRLDSQIAQRRCSASGDQPSPERWTMTQAFYANMGGYVIDTKPLDGKEYIPGSPRITLTARGICFLAQSSIIPNEAESFIQDKSKANALAKVITCMQGGWLVIQCIARLAYQLPITLLEINTVGHVLCAFAIYLFWFSKPLDINEPTVISTVVSSEKLEDLERLCALMWMGSSLSSKAITRHLKASDADSELESLLFYGLRIGQFTGRHGLPTTIVKSPSEEKAKFKIYKSQILDGTGFTLNPQSSRFSGIQRVIELDDTDIQRWRMASRVLEKKLRPDTYKEPAHTFVGGRFRDLVCGRCWDWPGRDLVGGEDTLGLYLPLATALYGGLHSAAWNAYFPTSTERDWWRYSSIIAASSGSVFSALSILSYLIHRTTAAIHIRNSYLILSQSLIGLGGWGLMVAFFVSRMFLVIEAFISLRKLPLAAYDTPRWLQDIPHI
jgi:hypothetical protein